MSATALTLMVFLSIFGYFIAITFGQQRWIKTLGIGHGEVLDLSRAGLAPAEASA